MKKTHRGTALYCGFINYSTIEILKAKKFKAKVKCCWRTLMS